MRLRRKTFCLLEENHDAKGWEEAKDDEFKIEGEVSLARLGSS